MADTTPSPPAGPRPGGGPAAVPRGEYRGRRTWGEPGAGDVIALAQDFGTELLGALRDSATAFVDDQRNRAANEIDAFGEVLRRSVQTLDHRETTAVARYADESARRISRFADRLRRRSLAGLTADLEDFVRRWPLACIASAIGVGLIAGRFLVSSAPDPANKNPAKTVQSALPRPVTGGEAQSEARYNNGVVGGGASGNSKTGSSAGCD